jgi:branched-chain amino acid transport system permease protein
MSERSSAAALSEWVTASDRRLLGAVLGFTAVVFTVLALVSTSSLDGTVSTVRRVFFFGAVYALVVLALNLQWGYAGMFNIGIAGFMAIGLYSMAILTMQIGLPYPVAAVGAVLVTALFGVIVALPALRLKADYLAIVTLAFAEIVRSILSSQQFSSFTLAGYDLGFGGATGPEAPPNPMKFLLYEEPYSLVSEPNAVGEGFFSLVEPLPIDGPTAEAILYVFFLLIVVGLFYVLLSRVGNSPFGRVLKAISEDETVARALGKDTRLFKIKAFALGAALMGLAAILWYLESGGVRPSNFQPQTTFFIFVALIIGGSGSNLGSIIGGLVFGAFLIQGPEIIETIISQRFNPEASPQTIFDAFSGLDPFLAYTIDNLASVRIILLGVFLIYLIQNRPEGLIGNRKEVASSIDLEDRSGGES